MRLQTDYQILICVTADILDALESSLKGIKLDKCVMQNIYSRLVCNQKTGLNSNQNFNQLRNGVNTQIPVDNFGASLRESFSISNTDYNKLK